MKLGDFLVKMIFWSGMSQAEVAMKCGISTPVLNDLVKNKRGINVRYAKAFEGLFGVPTKIYNYRHQNTTLKPQKVYENKESDCTIF